MRRRGALLVAWGMGMVTAGLLWTALGPPARVVLVLSRASTVGRVVQLLERRQLVRTGGPVANSSRPVAAGTYVLDPTPLTSAAAAQELTARATKR